MTNVAVVIEPSRIDLSLEHLPPHEASQLALKLIEALHADTVTNNREFLETALAILSKLDDKTLVDLAKAIQASSQELDATGTLAIALAAIPGSRAASEKLLRTALTRSLGNETLAQSEDEANSRAKLFEPTLRQDYASVTKLPELQNQRTDTAQVVDADGLEFGYGQVKSVVEITSEALKQLAEAVQVKDERKKHHDSDGINDIDDQNRQEKLKQSIHDIASQFPELSEVLQSLQNLPHSAFELAYVSFLQAMELREEVMDKAA